MALQTFQLNGNTVSVDCDSDVRMLWVIRDLLKVHGPKYGCGVGVCQACVSYVNGLAVDLCTVRVGDIKPTDVVTTIEGLAATTGTGAELHPMQQAWLDYDVGQCGYCQPGQIMAAVATVRRVRSQGREISESDIDLIRNICRCGTYPRIREAITAGAAAMSAIGI